MNFKHYIERHNLKHSEVAQKLGIDRSTLHNVLSGRRNPGDGLKLRIFHFTNGEVPVSVWFNYSLHEAKCSQSENSSQEKTAPTAGIA